MGDRGIEREGERETETERDRQRQTVVNPAAPPTLPSELDNFDQFLTTRQGHGSVHTAHDIRLQGVEGGRPAWCDSICFAVHARN